MHPLKQAPLILAFSLFFTAFSSAQTATFEIIGAKGTGETTGNIAVLTVKNVSDIPLEVRPQVFFIPPLHPFQSYFGRIPGGIIVLPGAMAVIFVTGYCADIHSPPVPDGEDMISVQEWIPAGMPSEVDDLSGFPLLTHNTVPFFDPEQISTIRISPGFSYGKTPPESTIVPVWPGTGIPVAGTIDPAADPAAFASLLVAMVQDLEIAAQNLVSTGQVSTPFAKDQQKQHETLVQQATWIVTGAVTGEPYEKDDFANVVYTQYEGSTGNSVGALPKDQKEKIDAGIDSFWDGFVATGVEAKVLIPTDDIPDLPGWGPQAGWACSGSDELSGSLADDFDELNELKRLIDEALKGLSENELAKEVEAIRALAELIEMLKDFDELDEEIFSDLKSFIDCNADPLRAKMKTVDGFKRSVLRPLKFLLKILKATVENDKKLSDLQKEAIKLVIKLLDKKIGAMDKALDKKSGGLEEAIQIFETIKTEADWPQEVLKTVFGNLWDDIILEIKNKTRKGTEFVLKIILKKILGSGNAAGSIAGIILDFYDFIDLLLLLDNLDELEEKWNLKLLEILDKARNGGMIVQDGATCNTKWAFTDKNDLAEVHTQLVMRCWCPDPDGDPGEGTWEDLPLKIKPENGKATTKHVLKTKENSGNVGFKIEIPPKDQWPCKGEKCMLLLVQNAYNSGGRKIDSRTSFVGVP